MFAIDKSFTPFQTISIHNNKFGVNVGVKTMDVKAKILGLFAFSILMR